MLSSFRLFCLVHELNRNGWFCHVRSHWHCLSVNECAKQCKWCCFFFPATHWPTLAPHLSKTAAPSASPWDVCCYTTLPVAVFTFMIILSPASISNGKGNFRGWLEAAMKTCHMYVNGICLPGVKIKGGVASLHWHAMTLKLCNLVSTHMHVQNCSHTCNQLYVIRSCHDGQQCLHMIVAGMCYYTQIQCSYGMTQEKSLALKKKCNRSQQVD